MAMAETTMKPIFLVAKLCTCFALPGSTLVRPKCGPTQLNIHSRGVFDHGDKHDSVFSGLYTFLKRRVDSVDTNADPNSWCQEIRKLNPEEPQEVM